MGPDLSRRDAAASVDRFLGEVHAPDDRALAALLLELKSLAPSAPPAPSAAVRELMGAPVPLRSRMPRGRRISLISVAIAASLGMGVSAAAAVSPDVRSAMGDAISSVVGSVLPGLVPPPAPQPPSVPGKPHQPAERIAPTPGATGDGMVPKPAPSRKATPSPHATPNKPDGSVPWSIQPWHRPQTTPQTTLPTSPQTGRPDEPGPQNGKTNSGYHRNAPPRDAVFRVLPIPKRHPENTGVSRSGWWT